MILATSDMAQPSLVANGQAHKTTSQYDSDSVTKIDVAEATIDPRAGQRIYDLIAELYPINRSITGDGARETLSVLGQRIPLERYEVPTGTAVLDWNVPKEWNIRDAYIANSRGEKVVDIKNSPLHVLGYSVPVRGRFPLSELKERIFTIPAHPDWIPFRYSYYDEDWGFCMTHRDFEKLEDGEYEVLIDSSLEEGSLSYGEWYLPGSSEDELLISVHIDHPAMCNDNLSGVAVAAALAELLGRVKNNRLSYRILFVPTTIGSITWLSRNKDKLDKVKGGFAMTCIGDKGGFTWKESRQGNTAIDKAVKRALRESGEEYELREFIPFGFDERQFCSPGFNLPFGCLFRTHPYQYPENHTSADNLDIMKPEKLGGALALCLNIVKILEGDKKYLNTRPEGEPQLGKHGIYRRIGGPIPQEHLFHLFWVLNYSDGNHSLLDIVDKSSFTFADVRRAADILLEHGLLVECD